MGFSGRIGNLARRLIRLFRQNGMAVLVFFLLLIILLYGDNNIFSILRTRHTLRELRAQKAYYEQRLAIDRQHLDELRTNSASLEKYAREQYFMHREGEDIYVVE